MRAALKRKRGREGLKGWAVADQSPACAAAFALSARPSPSRIPTLIDVAV